MKAATVVSIPALASACASMSALDLFASLF